MKSVILSGYYGFGNLGDELILKNIIKILNELGFDTFFATTDDIFYSKSKHKNVTFIKWNDYKLLNDTIKQIDLAVLGGGGLFQDFDKLEISGLFENRLGVHTYANVPLLSHIHRKPVAYLFNGVGPLFSEDSRRYTKFAYSLCNYISVRDKESKEVLEELGFKDIVISADPVFYNPIDIEKKNFSRPRIAISLRQWLNNSLQKYIEDSIRDFLEHFADRFDFCFISFQDHDDYNSDTIVYERLISKISKPIKFNLIKTKEHDLEYIERLFSNFDFLIGMRLHSIILSIKYKIPFLAIPYWNKIENLLKELDLQHLSINLKEPSESVLKEKFISLFKEKQLIIEKIQNTANRINERINFGIETFKKFLDDMSKSEHRPIPLEMIEETDYIHNNWVNYKILKNKYERQFNKNRYSYLQIDRIIKRANASKIIFYPSPIYWNIPLFQRPHQIFKELSKRGYLIFFLTPEPELDETRPIREINQNLYLISDIDIIHNLKDEKLILWITWTAYIFFKDIFRNSFVVYDYIDELDVFAYYCRFTEIDNYKLLISSDIVIATSNSLLQEVSQKRDDAILVPNGVFMEDFVVEDDHIPEDLISILDFKKPIIGFYGLIADWRIDYPLVNNIVNECSDYNFVFIGPSDNSFKKLESFPNLHLLGPKKYEELKYYIKYFDVAIIPYKIDRLTNSVFPVKLCEYMAAGKPVVSTALPECKKFKSVLVSETSNDFAKNLSIAIKLKDNSEYIDLLKKEASENTWQKRVDKIIEKLNSLPKNYKRELPFDKNLLIEEVKASNLLVDCLLAKNNSLFQDFKTAIRERDNTWLQLNRVIDEKDYISSLLNQNKSQLDSTKSQLDSTKSQLDSTKSQLDSTKSQLDSTKSQLDSTKSQLDSTKSQLDSTKSQLEDSQRRLFLIQAEYEGLRKLYYAVINSKTWQTGQLIGRFIGSESPWRKALGKVFKCRVSGSTDGNHLPDVLPSVQQDKDIQDTQIEVTKDAFPKGIFNGDLYDIFIFSMIDFSFRYQRPQQLASYLSKKGHRVFYLNITQYLSSDSERGFEIKEIGENLWEVFLHCNKALDIYGGSINDDVFDNLFASINELRRQFNMTTTVSLVHNPFWTVLALEMRALHGWMVIYDCLDEWETFNGMGRYLLNHEERLVRECDLLTVTADKLLKKWEPLKKDGIIVRNACDYDYFSSASHSELLNGISRPIIGFFGGIADWIEIDYIQYAASAHREWNFVLLGGIFTDVSSIEKLPNVHLLGNQPYHLMRDYLYLFDVCLIPFKKNKITEAVDPVKLYEYFSLGKPVVARDLYEIRFYKDVLYLFDSSDEFVASIEGALHEEGSQLRQKRISIASTNTWNHRIEQIDSAIKKHCQKASVIVITYNNLLYNKLCIESILNKTDYPNYEVIIVDNDSTDGTKDYLKTLRDSRIRVILNERNEGFARANNIGLNEATGEYIVFLNNDTVVTKGWITKLTGYLSRYHEIGLIGPVTNFCGNEAKINLPYEDIKDMDACAYEYVTKHEGRFFDIRMLALFCAAMRRDTYEKVGPLDETFGIGMFEDDDYSHRIKLLGLKVVCAEDIFIHHFGQGAFKKLIDDGHYNDLFERNRKYFEQKWGLQWETHQHRDKKEQLNPQS